MAQYLILIYQNENDFAATPPEARRQLHEAHQRFTEHVAGTGVKILGGNALQPTSTATTVRDDIVTDGPFVETKEALGGYYLIDAEDLDQALATAKLVPTVSGGVEVRPIMVIG